MAYGFLARIAHTFDQHQVIVDMISTSETTVSLTVSPDQVLDAVLLQLKEFANVTVDYGKCIVCVVGEGIPESGTVASRMLTVLENKGIRLDMISQARIGINISVLINDEDIDTAVTVLHGEFFE